MNLNQIDYFIAVAKELNFTTASKKMFISQPSLSKQISLLEKELGVILIERTNRSVKLTPAGIEFYKEFSAINEMIQTAMKKVQMIGLGNEGTLSIGCLETIDYKSFFPQLLSQFSSEYPKCQVTIERYCFKDLREKLENGTLDIIFTLSFELESLKEIEWVSIEDRKGSIILSANHWLSQGEELDFGALSSIPLIVISEVESKYSNAALLKKCNENGFTPTTIISVANINTLISQVELGLGFTVLDKSICNYRSSFLKYYEMRGDSNDYFIMCAWKESNLNPSKRLFKRILNSIYVKDE